MTTPNVSLYGVTNWTYLEQHVDWSTISETLNSATSYTVYDPTSGMKLQMIGTGFSVVTQAGQKVLNSGVVTGFRFWENGTLIATGSGYALNYASASSALRSSYFDQNAVYLFDLWFPNKTVVKGSVWTISHNLTNLEAYTSDIAIDVTSGTLNVSVSQFGSFAWGGILNDVVRGFTLRDTPVEVENFLPYIENDIAHIKAISLTGASPTLQLTTSEAPADAAVIAKLVAPCIVQVYNTTNHAYSIQGRGDKLRIVDVQGVDWIRGNGNAETFVFAANFGQARILDSESHWLGASHDIIDFAKSEFANFAALLSDAHFGVNGTAIVSGTDRLVIAGLTTKAEFLTAAQTGDFHFL